MRGIQFFPKHERSCPVPIFFDALPAFLGGKRRLCRLIFALLATEAPQARWRGLTLVDPFLGGGSVSQFAKAVGFHVQSLAIVLVVKWALRTQPMSMLRGTDARDPFEGDLDQVSSRWLGHYLEQLLDLIRPHRPNIRAVRVPYRHLGSIASEVKNAQNEEYIVLATT